MAKQMITTAQLEYVRSLLRACEFDLQTCGLFHVQVAREARIDSPFPAPGDKVDDWLSTVTKLGAGRLINVLRERAA